MRERYRTIARVVKAHGRRGEVVTVSVHDLPSLVREGLEVAVLPPELLGPRWRMVTSCGSDDRGGQLVGLSGVGDIASAEGLVGKYLLARRSDLPDDLDLHDPRALLGREVVDGRLGALGTIDEVMRGPANDVWVVRGELGETLLPVVDAVVGMPPDEGPIPVRVPAGLEPSGGGDR